MWGSDPRRPITIKGGQKSSRGRSIKKGIVVDRGRFHSNDEMGKPEGVDPALAEERGTNREKYSVMPARCLLWDDDACF